MSTIAELKAYIKNIGGRVTHATKKEYKEYIESLYWFRSFPWRDEQTLVFDTFKSNNFRYIVIQGIFGVGKSQMLLGLLFQAIMEQNIRCNEIVYTAFNVCVKNEIKKKIASFGIKNKVTVSTFDSIIYKLCKLYGMENVDEPNYEGRRKFVYNKVSEESIAIPENFNSVKLLIVDECQDLEIQALDVFKTFFPSAICVFAGDILQSIQKEPKESVLWQIIMNDKKYDGNMYKKIVMYETPRVPKNILSSLQGALSKFYPELSTEFGKWKSRNTVTDGNLSWHQFKNYTQLFKDILAFCNQHDHNDVMILTFSSSITVRGSLGDVSRIRNFLRENNIIVNNNHKSMEKGKVFLSTANSSKGLERKYVFVVLTFPLEKAFINFSNDLIMNLVTVAISRALYTVDVYIPNIIEKVSPIIEYYDNVPKATVHYKFEQKKGQKDSNVIDYGINNYLFENVIEKEHSVTEILRLGVLKYETLSFIKSFTKVLCKFKLCQNVDNIKQYIPHLFTDEERTLTGLFIEYLITSEWGSSWPFTPIDITSLEKNPIYKHCIHQISNLMTKYQQMTHIPFKNASKMYIFDTLYIYAQLMLSYNHRVFTKLCDSELRKLSDYWNNHLCASVVNLKPSGVDSEYIKIQSNCRMPFMTGIIDMFVEDNTSGYKNHIFYEIKACTAYDWEIDAFSQSVLYVLMNAKSRSTVVLINPLKNIVIKYVVDIPDINTVRTRAMYDCVLYNSNSYLSKNLKQECDIYDKFNILNCMFLQVDLHEGGSTIHANILNLFSPTKICNVFDLVGSDLSLEDASLLPQPYTYIRKLAKESKMNVSQVVDTMSTFVSTHNFTHIYCTQQVKDTWFKNDKRIQLIKSLQISSEKHFNTKNTFMQNVYNIVNLSNKFKFVY